MGLRFCFDRTPAMAPVYDCDKSEETLTYDWERRVWIDAKNPEGNRCRGLNSTGTGRTVIASLCDALIELQEAEAEGLVVIPWSWHDGHPLLSLLFFSNHEELEDHGPPDWLPFEGLDRESLVVGSVMFS